MGPGQEGACPHGSLVLPLGPTSLGRPHIQLWAGAGQLGPCGLELSLKPGMRLDIKACTQQPCALTRPAGSQAIAPALSWLPGYRHCHHQCLMGGIPEKQGCVGRWGGKQTGLGSRRTLMRQLGLAATEPPTRTCLLAHPKQTQPRPRAHPPARCPGNSQPPPPSWPQRLDGLSCQESATAGSPNRTPLGWLGKDRSRGLPLSDSITLLAISQPEMPPTTSPNPQGSRPFLAEVAFEGSESWSRRPRVTQWPNGQVAQAGSLFPKALASIPQSLTGVHGVLPTNPGVLWRGDHLEERFWGRACKGRGGRHLAHLGLPESFPSLLCLPLSPKEIRPRLPGFQ